MASYRENRTIIVARRAASATLGTATDGMQQAWAFAGAGEQRADGRVTRNDMRRCKRRESWLLSETTEAGRP